MLLQALQVASMSLLVLALPVMVDRFPWLPAMPPLEWVALRPSLVARVVSVAT
jgi:hypothetical protein